MFGSATIDLSNYATKTDLNGKVDKVTGKGLSTNDFTNAEKNKLTGIEAGANKTVVDDELDEESGNPVQNAVVKAALNSKADLTDLAPEYDSEATYEVGDYVTYSGDIYRCTTAITTAEAWAAAHWTQVAIGAELTRYNEDITELSETVDGKVDDVRVNGISVVNQGVANIPLAGTNASGVIRTANDSDVKNGTNFEKAIVPLRQHAATFYGLAKSAGSDEKNSSLAVGQYTDAAKVAIQKMLGIYEPPFELLNDITLDEISGIGDITADSNGTPYNLLGIYICIEYPANSLSIESGYSRYQFYDTNNSYVSAETGRYASNTQSKYKHVMLERIGSLSIVRYTKQAVFDGDSAWYSKSYGIGRSILNGTRRNTYKNLWPESLLRKEINHEKYIHSQCNTGSNFRVPS